MPGVFHERFGLDIGVNIGNIIPVAAHRFDPIGPFSVLNPAAMLLAGIFFGRQYSAVSAKPAQVLERPPWSFFHLLHPAA